MSLKEWADLHGEDYPSRFRRETSTKPPTIKDLQFCFDELLGELGWDDEIAETGVDPLSWARNEIKDLHKQIKRLRGSLELRKAAEHSVQRTGWYAVQIAVKKRICRFAKNAARRYPAADAHRWLDSLPAERFFMSYYSLGCEVHATATYSKIAEAVDEETAKMLVDVLNASQQSVERTIEHKEDCAINVGMLGECDCGAE